MNIVTRTFIKGLVALLPITVTAYVLYWLATTAEGVVGAVLPDALYVPGMGLVVGIALVFVAGVLMNTWFALRFVAQGERLLKHVPLVKTLYGSVRDLMGLFGGSDRAAHMDQVVLVAFEDGASWLLGFVTREDLTVLGPRVADRVAVYLPMSYQIGGFTLFVERTRLEPIDMSVEDAMRFAVTAGVSRERGGATRRDEGRP